MHIHVTQDDNERPMQSYQSFLIEDENDDMAVPAAADDEGLG